MTKKKVSKKAPSVKTVDSVDVSNELLDRVAKLERQVDTLQKGLTWAGEQIKMLFGVGAIGAYITEVASKLKKVK